MKRVTEYLNRYGDTYRFTRQKDDSVLVEGDFDYMKVGGDYIDTPGGPFLKIGQQLSEIVNGDGFDLTIEGFTNSENGIIIQTNFRDIDQVDLNHLMDSDVIENII